MASNIDFMKEKSYACNRCDAVFFAESNFQKHAKEHGGEKKSCVYCGKRIERAQNLKLHQQTCVSNIDRNHIQRGRGADSTGNIRFQLVQSALKKTIVIFRKPLNTQRMEDVEDAMKHDVPNLLQREVTERKVMK